METLGHAHVYVTVVIYHGRMIYAVCIALNLWSRLNLLAEPFDNTSFYGTTSVWGSYRLYTVVVLFYCARLGSG